MTTAKFDLEAFANSMRAQGLWKDQTYERFFANVLATTPDKTALVAQRADRSEPTRLTFRELDEKVGRAAAALRKMGVTHGDVVSVQLPNWWEFAVASYACFRLGAVFNPLMPIFRERELTYMLGFAESKVFICPKAFRGFNHEELAQQLQSNLPALKQLVIVGGEGENSFDTLLMGETDCMRIPATIAEEALQPDDLSVLMYTSGTTGSPKGVMHSSNTLFGCNIALTERFGLNADDVLLSCSPVGHMTGYAAGVLLGLRLGATVVLQDIWEVKAGLSIMEREKVTFIGASTPFLTDMCEAVKAGAVRPKWLSKFLCGGAAIPPVMIERARSELGLLVSSLWGMTECLSGTLTEPEKSATKSATTDGRAVRGMEVQIVGADGHVLPTGETGRLMVRGVSMLRGYYKQPEIPTFDANGWFDTGDLAFMDLEGYIRINGRTKDVIIRGGENIPVFEIESVLHKHPNVASAALVGYHDDRLGERGCAFIVLRNPGTEKFDMVEMQAWMAQNKVSKTYWPERVKVIDMMPTNPAGKIQKFLLRDMTAE